MLTTIERTIGATTYTITQLGAKQGRSVMVRLFRILGPAAAGLTSGEDIEARLGNALTALARSASEDDFNALCDTFAAATKIRKTTETNAGPGHIDVPLTPDFDNHFAGRYAELLQWFGACIEVNFASFFDGAGGAKAFLEMLRKGTS